MDIAYVEVYGYICVFILIFFCVFSSFTMHYIPNSVIPMNS